MGKAASRTLPREVIALGIVSMFMDVSSEMIHSLLPVFLVSVLGLNTLMVGLIEGIAESTAAITKIFAGVASDWIGKRKPLVLLGYGIAALTKPLFPLANGAGAVLIARFLDRIGKGIRGAPRDALVADLTAESMRGAAYGVRQSMDTIGAVAVSRLSWKWRERSAVKITERTREKTTEALHRRRESRHPQAAFAGTGTSLKAM